MLMYSMGVSIDGFISDRDGNFDWGAPSPAQFRFHNEEVRGLGGAILGRRLYEAMLPWETDPAMRRTDTDHEFAEIWAALPKVVFSRTLDRVEGNARLATGSLPDEVAAMLERTDEDVEIGGAGLAASALQLGIIDELRIFRYPVVVGGGTPFIPPLPTTSRFDLIETRTFGGRVVYEKYRRTSSAG